MTEGCEWCSIEPRCCGNLVKGICLSECAIPEPVCTGKCQQQAEKIVSEQYQGRGE